MFHLIKWFLVFAFLSVICFDSDADKPKRILTGQEAELFEALIKAKDGTQYGWVFQPGDFGKLMWIVIANVVAWFGVFGFKVYDRITGKGDQVSRDIREIKDALLRLDSNSKHWVTDKEVGQKVRD